MSEETNSREKYMNKCFVLLRPLDKKILERYSKKKSDKSKNFVFHKKVRIEDRKPLQERTVLVEHYTKSHNRWEKSSDNFTEKSKETIVKSPRTGKNKIRVKPIYYTDDEDNLNEVLNPNENVLDKTKTDEETQRFNISTEVSFEAEGSQIPQKSKLSCLKKRYSDNSEKDVLSIDGTNGNEMQRVKKPKCIINDENVQKTACNCKDSNFQSGDLSQINKHNPVDKKEVTDNDRYDIDESEVEVIEVPTRSDKFQQKANTVTNTFKSNTKDITATEFKDEENEARDDDEDDRATVIFEKNIDHTITDIEGPIKVTERKNLNSENLNKNKITNRKKQNFVQFKPKRKRLGGSPNKTGRNKKKQIKIISDVYNRKQTPTENGVDEDRMREFCYLVKRIHELYRIIFQLRKDLPRNTEKAHQFLKAVKTQEENFMREIKKSQKNLFEDYDKMLNHYGNPNKVFREIGKRTSLSENDISNVISRCTLVEGTREEIKLMNGVEQKESNSSQEVPPQRVETENNSKKPTNGKKETVLSTERTKTKKSRHVLTVEDCLSSTLEQNRQNDVSGLTPPVFPFCISGNKKTLLPTPNLDSRMARETFAWNLPSQQLDPNKGQKVDHTKTRPYSWSQNNYTHNIHPPVMRDAQDLTKINSCDIHSNYTKSSSSQPTYNQLSNSTRAQYSYYNTNYPFYGHTPISGTPGVDIRLPSPMDLDNIGYNNTMNQYPSLLNPSLSVLNLIQMSPQQSFVMSGYNYPPYKTYKKSFKSSNSSKRVRNHTVFRPTMSTYLHKHTVPDISWKENNPSRSTAINSLKYIQPTNNTLDNTEKIPGDNKSPIISWKTKTNTNYTIRNRKAERESVEVESSHLDPTVPQKLTMRDSRLQAGPWFEFDRNNDSNERHRSLSEDVILNRENLNENESNSRVYMCARNECKNVGVRICEGCMSIIYCSETCQSKHWTSKHKTECHQLKELRG